MDHRVSQTETNWHLALAILIRQAKDGDRIVVTTDAMVSLAERAKARMCPEKEIVILREEEEAK